jgi:sulfur transfer complex TusBCD TusB component (DsrH family)
LPRNLKQIIMEIKISTKTLLLILHVVSWIIFIGLSIEAAGILTRTVATLALSPDVAARFWKSVDLSELFRINESQFVTLSTIIIIVSILKSILFYCIIRVFLNKNLNFSSPFNVIFKKLILTLAYLSFGIGWFSSWGAKVTKQLSNNGLTLQDNEQLHIDGADVWLFMGVILLIVAYFFRKGIELQEENELTI